jgi:hypothetical protein
VNPLEPPDSQHLQTAEAWAELLAFEEVGYELAKIRPQFRNHPDVLAVRWVVAANTRQWLQALEFAKDIVRLAPDRPQGWSVPSQFAD